MFLRMVFSTLLIFSFISNRTIGTESDILKQKTIDVLSHLKITKEQIFKTIEGLLKDKVIDAKVGKVMLERAKALTKNDIEAFQKKAISRLQSPEGKKLLQHSIKMQANPRVKKVLDSAMGKIDK